jgi:phosphomannomutase
MKFTESIFKSYDIRGISGEELTTDVARAVGRAVADFLPNPGPVIVGRDMRVDSGDLSAALIDGLTRQGRDVWDIGLVTTDMVYFGAGRYADETAGGVMVTASHNPGKYNGIKLIGKGSVPMGAQNGLMDIKRIVREDDFKPEGKRGVVIKKSIVEAWIDKVLEFVDVKGLPAYNIAIDAGNGMGGAIFPALEKRLPFKVHEMYFELDGTFPNHVANPKLVETLADISNKIKKNKLDFGLATDGDGDRGGVIDDQGNPVPEYIMGALLAKQFLAENPGSAVVIDLRVSHLVWDTVVENGGKPVRSKVGNDDVKTHMRNNKAVLGVEASGHYYFRDDYYSDSGLIALMSVVNILAKSGKKMSELVAELGGRYATADETNLKVDDAKAVLEKLRTRYDDGKQDELDGLTVQYPEWWFNLRVSNTEPLVRLNVEANKKSLLDEKLEELKQIITE